MSPHVCKAITLPTETFLQSMPLSFMFLGVACMTPWPHSGPSVDMAHVSVRSLLGMLSSTGVSVSRWSMVWVTH